MTCKCVTFRNRSGHRLFGIVHHPDSGVFNPVPVILLSPGLKYRVAPHRLYVKLARHLADKGYVVLRFDFAGLGDSEGLVHEAVVADFYGTVQSGRYVEDTQAAMDWMQKEYNASRFILGGLCGGAITGLLAGARDRRMVGLIALGLPVLLDGQHVDPTKFLTAGEIGQWRTGYISKLTDVKSWLRLLTFRSNYRVIGRVLRSALPRRKAAVAVAPPATTAGLADNFNPLVPEALDNVASCRPMLLIFGEGDRLQSIYEERLAQPYGMLLQRHRRNIEVRVVAEANHIFALPDWERAMWDHVDSWLQRHQFGEAIPEAAARSLP